MAPAAAGPACDALVFYLCVPRTGLSQDLRLPSSARDVTLELDEIEGPHFLPQGSPPAAAAHVAAFLRQVEAM
jgi:hypothetical protein